MWWRRKNRWPLELKSQEFYTVPMGEEVRYKFFLTFQGGRVVAVYQSKQEVVGTVEGGGKKVWGNWRNI